MNKIDKVLIAERKLAGVCIECGRAVVSSYMGDTYSGIETKLSKLYCINHFREEFNKQCIFPLDRI